MLSFTSLVFGKDDILKMSHIVSKVVSYEKFLSCLKAYNFSYLATKDLFLIINYYFGCFLHYPYIFLINF